MSDNEAIDYVPRAVEEVKNLHETLVQAVPFAGYQYVAAPAPGWDTEGVWVSFATAHRTGYSVAAVSATLGLSDGFGLPTQLIPHRYVDIDPALFPADRRELYDRWHETKVGQAHLLVASYPPIDSAELRARRDANDTGICSNFVCHTVSEATRISKFAVDICNNNFEEVWVMSDFCRRAFIDSGVDETRVRTVVPMLYGGPWKQRLAAHGGATYRFGTQGTWHARKGMLDLVRSYYNAFSASDDVVLEIRTSQMGGRAMTIKEMLTKVGEEIRVEKVKFSKSLPKIVVHVGTDDTDQAVLDWLAGLDCYANPSYGEGVGIPPIWAAMAGVPVITSDFGAPGEYFAARKNPIDFVIPHHLVRVDPSMPAFNRIYDFSHEWGGYDVGEFSASMRAAYDSGRRFSHEAAERTRRDYGMSQLVSSMRPAMEKFLPAKMLELM